MVGMVVISTQVYARSYTCVLSKGQDKTARLTMRENASNMDLKGQYREDDILTLHCITSGCKINT